MRTKDDVAVIQAMGRFGGSFALALSRAAELADDSNLERIKGAFPELWSDYRDMARLSAERDAAKASA